MLENTNSTEIKEVTAEIVLPLIRSFFDQITCKQWNSLRSGNPDFATKILLAEFIVDLIEIIRNHIVHACKKANIPATEEDLLTLFTDSVSQAFANVLQVKDGDHTSSSVELTDLMVKEVVQSFQSADSESAGEERISQRIVPPKRLEEMVNSAVQMIRGFCSKLDCMPSCKRRTTSPDEEPHSSTQVGHLDIKVDLENVLEKVVGNLDIKVDLENVLEKVVGKEQEQEMHVTGHKDSLKTETSEIVRAVIHEAVNELSEIIDEELIKLAEYSPLLSDIAEENESFTSSLANSVVEDISEGPCGSWSLAQIKEKIQQSLKKAADKIKSFFAKRFAKVMILRTAIQLWSRCHSTPAAKSSESVQKLVEHVNSLITNKETLEKEKNEFKRLQDCLSQGKLLVFTELLTDILHQYTSEGTGPEIVPEQVVMAERQKILHNDLQTKARRFLGLFRWWLNTQAESHSQRVILALLDKQELMLSLPSVTTETIKPSPVAEFYCIARKAEKKAKLKLILHKLISTTFKEANLLCTYQDPNHILTWLLDYVWAELEDEELYITSKTFKTIDKKLLKDLCNTMGFIERVIVSMELQESETAKCIVASLKDRLGKPKAKRSAIVRFFCALGRAIAKPFRRNT
ncbi:unnamed protein product [Oreochromis niloticus]|nr:unnamed protein product [Mustela putorius furo]